MPTSGKSATFPGLSAIILRHCVWIRANRVYLPLTNGIRNIRSSNSCWIRCAHQLVHTLLLPGANEDILSSQCAKLRTGKFVIAPWAHLTHCIKNPPTRTTFSGAFRVRLWHWRLANCDSRPAHRDSSATVVNLPQIRTGPAPFWHRPRSIHRCWNRIVNANARAPIGSCRAVLWIPPGALAARQPRLQALLQGTVRYPASFPAR